MIYFNREAQPNLAPVLQSEIETLRAQVASLTAELASKDIRIARLETDRAHMADVIAEKASRITGWIAETHFQGERSAKLQDELADVRAWGQSAYAFLANVLSPQHDVLRNAPASVRGEQ